MSMNQHELETAHFRALIDAHDLKRTVLELDYDDECTVLARAEFNDAMERVVQVETAMKLAAMDGYRRRAWNLEN